MHLFDHTTAQHLLPAFPGAPFVESASLRSCQTSSFSLELGIEGSWKSPAAYDSAAQVPRFRHRLAASKRILGVYRAHAGSWSGNKTSQ